MSARPKTSAINGRSYSFDPAVVDSENDTLSYSVENLPDWMTLDPATGVLSGTPSLVARHGQYPTDCIGWSVN